MLAAALVDRLPVDRRDAWIAWASTDLTNLADHPLGCLLASAVTTTGLGPSVVGWALLALLGLIAQGLHRGAGRGLGSAVVVHVLATLFSQGVVAYRIGTGALPPSARVMTDVGPSYLVVAVLVTGAVRAGPAGRVICGTAVLGLAPTLSAGICGLAVAPVGHAASGVLATVPAIVGARRVRPTGGR